MRNRIAGEKRKDKRIGFYSRFSAKLPSASKLFHINILMKIKRQIIRGLDIHCRIEYMAMQNTFLTIGNPPFYGTNE